MSKNDSYSASMKNQPTEQDANCSVRSAKTLLNGVMKFVSSLRTGTIQKIRIIKTRKEVGANANNRKQVLLGLINIKSKGCAVMTITEKYKFSDEIIKAFKIKDNKIHAFLPMVSVHPYEKTIRNEPHANDISVIAEITAEAETEKYVRDNDSHIMLKNITVTKTYYYEGMDNICFCSPKGWDEEVVSPFDKGISFVDKKETVYSLFPAAHGTIYRTLFSTRKEAELHVFGSNPKYEFVISKTDKATETETLDIEMYLPVEYTDSAMRRDGKRHAYREHGYLIFKPCKDAHIKKIDGYGHCILADKVIPISTLSTATSARWSAVDWRLSPATLSTTRAISGCASPARRTIHYGSRTFPL